MPTSSRSDALTLPVPSGAGEARPLVPWRPAWPVLAAGLARQAPAAAALAAPDLGDWTRTDLFATGASALGLVLLIVGAAADRLGPLGARIVRLAPWLILLALLFAIWEFLTAKLGWLPQPFLPPPQALLEVFTDDFAKLGTSAVASIKLLATGYAVGPASASSRAS
jgi:NitT/TauT family transport system permease protein